VPEREKVKKALLTGRSKRVEGDWIHLIEWIERLPTPIVVHRKGRILYANPEALKLFRAKKREDFVGKRVLDFIHPDSLEAVKKRLKNISKFNPYLPRQEEKLVRVDGSVLFTEVTGIKVLFQGKESIAAFIWDVSEQKSLEKKTRETDQLIHTLWSSLPVGVFYKDREGVYRHVNEPYARLAGLTPEEMIGKTAKDCWPEPFGKVFHRDDLRLMEKKKAKVFRQAFSAKDGKKVSGLLHLTPVFDTSGKVIGALGVFQDTTLAEKAWRSLKREKERLTTLINASPDIICFKDDKGRWLLANKADLELFHLTGVNYRGKTDLELASKTLPIYRQAFETCKATDEATWASGKIHRSEERIPTPDGKTKIFDIYKIPLFNPDGSRKGLLVIGRDITPAREMEEKLRKTEETSRAILDALPDIVFTLDKEGRFLSYHSPEIGKLYLLPKDFLGKRIVEALPRNVVTPFMRAIKRVLESNKIQTFTYSLEINGKLGHFECRMVPKGKEEILAVVRDVTERWRYDRELREKERKFRNMSQLFQLIADNNPDMLWAKDVKSRYIFTNRALREKLLMAKNAEEPLGKDDLYFAHRVRAERFGHKKWYTFGEIGINSDKVILKSLKPMRFDEYGYVQGKFLRLDVAKAPLFDEKGRVIGTVGSARDVTREKQLEEQQKRAQAELTRIATVVKQATQSVVITDLKGNIVYVNPAFEKATGYTYEEVKGKNPRILKSGKQDRKFYEKLWATITAGKTWEGTFINKKKNGEIYYEKAVIFPIRNENGKIIQFAAVKNDITREMILEQQFLQAQKMEAVGNLAGGMAHDFNNFLNVVLGFCELGLQKLDKNAPGYHEFFTILSAARKAEGLVNQLLAFSRKQVAIPETLDINETISTLGKMIQRLIPEDIDIFLNLAPGLPYIEADPGQIEQILMNLVINARDAIQEVSKETREKKITIATEEAIIDEQYVTTHYGARKGKYVVIAVSDTGSGMDEATQARIFEPFFTTKKTGKGTGLGLSTVFGIVEQNKGFITVHSKLHYGTTLKIYWPIVEKPSKPKHETNLSSHSTNLVTGKASILFVEDVPELRDLAAETLENLGYTVFTAPNGQKALEIFKKRKKEIDLIITDLVMPVMNGTELSQEVKKLIPDLPIIYTSGYAENHFSHGILLKDRISFLKKPYTIAQLSSKINEALKRRPLTVPVE